MGSIVASTIIAQASEVLEDEANVVWEESQLLVWLDEAQLAVCLVRPDANTVNHSVLLTKDSTKQTIDGRRLLAVVRNMGSDGSTPGRGVRLVERGIKDEFDPDWHTETPSTEILEYVWDARDPDTYYVSPPAHAATDVYLEIIEAVNPDPLSSTSDTIDVDDIYQPVLVEWLLYRGLSRDSEETPMIQSAAVHLTAFMNILGAKTEIDSLINPKVRAHLQG